MDFDDDLDLDSFSVPQMVRPSLALSRTNAAIYMDVRNKCLFIWQMQALFNNQIYLLQH